MQRTRNAAVAAQDDFQFALARTAPQLDAEQERALARRLRDHGDRRAAQELSRANLRTVTGLAAKYRGYGVPVAELIAEGNCGLVHALGKFDPERGVRFASYATHWVRAYILSYVLRSRSIVGGSSGLMRAQIFFKFRRERARLTTLLGEGEACELALAERLQLSRRRVTSLMQRVDTCDVSLDAPARRDSTASLRDQLTTESDPEQELLKSRFYGRVSGAVLDALSRLDERERYIVEQRWLAEGGEELSLAQIGRRFGISRERARQIECRAKRKLRSSMTSSGDDVLEWIA